MAQATTAAIASDPGTRLNQRLVAWNNWLDSWALVSSSAMRMNSGTDTNTKFVLLSKAIVAISSRWAGDRKIAAPSEPISPKREGDWYPGADEDQHQKQDGG